PDARGLREDSLRPDQAQLASGLQKFHAHQSADLELKRPIDSRVSALEQSYTATDRLSGELAAREARIAPDEARLAERSDALAQKETELKVHEDLLTARTETLDAQDEDLNARERALQGDRGR